MTGTDETWELQREVSRIAHELSERHGWNAGNYARNMAEKALADGRQSDHNFWSRVAASLAVR